ncbi:MAG: hypothetical protein LBO80_07900, partial [Treponema sp.]|nr:hypothetical protein [Treponema sp.]
DGIIMSEAGIGMNPAYNPYLAERRYRQASLLRACSWVSSLASFDRNIPNFYLKCKFSFVRFAWFVVKFL